MIDFVHGTLVESRPGRAVVSCAGVGYRVHTLPATWGSFPPAGSEVKLHTHLQILEDARHLYGFLTAYDRDVFQFLCSVSGIGPRMAMKALSEYSPADVVGWIHRGDEVSLRRIKGLGPKLVAKMILELKDKASAYVSGPDSAPEAGTATGVRDECELALKGLGYKDQELKPVLQRVFSQEGRTLEDAIRESLRLLAKA